MKNFSQKFAAQFRGLRNDSEGVAAVEFALVLPILVMLLLGTFELGQALTVDRRVTQVASSAADLIAQGSTIDDAGLQAVMDLSDSILSPYDANLLNIEVVSVLSDSDGNTTVGWSYNKAGGEPYSPGSSYTLAGDLANLLSPNSSIIIAKASYNYTPVIGQFLLGGVLLSETFHLRPRKSVFVAKS